MSEENKEFRVVDKRFSASSEEEKKSPEQEHTTAGAGFVMKEGQETKAPPPPSQIDFSTLVFSLATGALINLGLAPDPATHQVHKNLELAKQNIDILVLLQQKTKGNLSQEESKLLENLVAETQLRYVEASR